MYAHLSCQRSPDSCFETSSWTHYDVTVHHVRTHTIHTIFAFFKVLILFHFAVLSSVTSSLVGVSSIGIMSRIMSCHHCPIITEFQLHAFQFTIFQFGQDYRQYCSCSFVVSGFGFTICYGSRFVGVQFGGIDGFCCGWLGCVGVQFNCRNFVSSFSFSSSFSEMQEGRKFFYHSDQDFTDTPSLVTPLPPLLDTKLFHFLQILQRKLSLSHPVS